MYTLIKPLLFHLDPEKAHKVALKGLQLCHQLGLMRLLPALPRTPHDVFGLRFPNRVGIAAGMDKDAEYIDALAALGAGFIEAGTVTPKPQPGNPRPRLFRLTKEKAIINRMGFNSKGLNYFCEQLDKMHYKGILGINIVKNRSTPNEEAITDYLTCFKRVWKYASYIAINVSSPNTPGLRELQQADNLMQLLAALKTEQRAISHLKYVPLVVKIAPDLTKEALDDIADILLKLKIDGVIATNSTLQRDNIQHSPYASEAGGLSGKPLTHLSTVAIKHLHNALKGKIPIIASGGVIDTQSAEEKIKAGASLVQVFSGLIYQGPLFLRQLVKADLSFLSLQK